MWKLTFQVSSFVVDCFTLVWSWSLPLMSFTNWSRFYTPSNLVISTKGLKGLWRLWSSGLCARLQCERVRVRFPPVPMLWYRFFLLRPPVHSAVMSTWHCEDHPIRMRCLIEVWRVLLSCSAIHTAAPIEVTSLDCDGRWGNNTL